LIFHAQQMKKRMSKSRITSVGGLFLPAVVPHWLITSFPTVETLDVDVIVQPVDPGSGGHVISAQAAKNDHIRVHGPQGRLSIRLIEGQKWHGVLFLIEFNL